MRRTPRTANRSGTPARFFISSLCTLRRPCYASSQHDFVHRHQANYHRDAVVVDYVDSDYVDYDRFRRVEKLAS
jgi:hypothetical protein